MEPGRLQEAVHKRLVIERMITILLMSRIHTPDDYSLDDTAQSRLSSTCRHGWALVLWMHGERILKPAKLGREPWTLVWLENHINRPCAWPGLP